MIGAPLFGGAKEVQRRRLDEDQFQHLWINHDAYAARFGTIHERELWLGANGRELRGVDRFSGGFSVEGAIRFHLHPNVEVSQAVGNDKEIFLTLPGGAAWRFRCLEANVEVEASVFFAGSNGPQTTQQLIIRVDDLWDKEFNWQLSQQ